MGLRKRVLGGQLAPRVHPIMIQYYLAVRRARRLEPWPQPSFYTTAAPPPPLTSSRDTQKLPPHDTNDYVRRVWLA